MLLAIDTATRCASLALYEPGKVLAEQTWQSNDNHTIEMMPGLVDMLGRQGVQPGRLKAIGVTIGPGSFTGLRIGLAAAKGLAMSLDIPVIGVPTLDILPYAVGQVGSPNWSVIQAGRGRLCYAEYRYQIDNWHRQSEFEAGTVADFTKRLQGSVYVCGELSQTERALIQACLGDQVVIVPPAFSLRRAGFLAEIAWRRLERGEVDVIEHLAPAYIHFTGETRSA
jgi:tRNA threonylcarbamoyladenosine biosynthesis protein TsaB